MGIESLKHIVSLIDNSKASEFIIESFEIEIEPVDIAEAINALDSYTIYYEMLKEKIRIRIEQKDFKIFKNGEDFLARINKEDFSKNLLILTDRIVYDTVDNITFSLIPNSDPTYIFENTFYYFIFLDFLKLHEHKEDNAFYFVDYYSLDKRNIVFTSLRKEGKLTIVYDKKVPHFNEKFSIKERCIRFFEAFNENNKHLPKFIKIELFNYLGKEEKAQRLKLFIDKLDEIIDTAEQNFDLYLSDLSLEKIKTEYVDYKNKYYTQLREILGKITNQVIAFPITISASAFATYKVTDSTFTLLIMLLVFVAFTVYATFLLRIHKEDILDIEISVNNDFNKLKVSDFFNKNPDELESFLKVKSRLDERITLLRRSLDIYFCIVTVINTLFIGFILFQMMMSIKMIAILTIVFIMALILYFIYKL